MLALKISATVMVVSYVIAWIAGKFQPPQFTNSVFDEYNWASYVTGIAALVFVIAAVTTLLLGIWSLL